MLSWTNGKKTRGETWYLWTSMRYTHHRGLARVTSWVRLKYAAMNLKKLAEWSCKNSFLHHFFSFFSTIYAEAPAFA